MSICEMNKTDHDELLIHNKVVYLTYFYTWVISLVLHVFANLILSLGPNLILPTKRVITRP